MRSRIALVSLLAAELMIITAIASLGDLRSHLYLYMVLFAAASTLGLLAARELQRTPARLAFIILAACLLRVPMFLTQPSLSDDVWRYLHDGRAQLAHVNPYAYAPADSRTESYRGPEFDRINHKHLPTIYPPVAQYFFGLAARFPDPLLAWRVILLAAELTLMFAGALLLRTRSAPAAIALYAWHPLAIMESIGSAHVEPLAIAFLALALLAVARARHFAAGAALAVSVAAKLVAAPLLLLLPIGRRTVLAFACTLVLAYLPFAFGASPFGSFGVFAETWESNGSFFVLMAPLVPGRAYRILAFALLMGVVLALRRRAVDLPTATAAFFMALFLLAPVVHPWYLLWVLAAISWREHALDGFGAAAWVWTVTVVCAYSAHLELAQRDVWRVPAMMLFLEYLPVATLLILSLPRARVLTGLLLRSPARTSHPAG